MINSVLQRVLQRRAAAQQQPQPQSYPLAPMQQMPQYINSLMPQSGTGYDANFAQGIRNQSFQYLPMPQFQQPQMQPQVQPQVQTPQQMPMNIRDRYMARFQQPRNYLGGQ